MTLLHPRDWTLDNSPCPAALVADRSELEPKPKLMSKTELIHPKIR